MKNASERFDPEQRTRIRKAVALAESFTSAEILPVVATSSGRYDRAEDMVGLWFGGAAAAVVAWLAEPAQETGGWESAWGDYEVVLVVAALVVFFVIGAALATHVGWLRRLFTLSSEMETEVQARSHALFFDHRVHRTAGATGLLIYVSLYERMAAVVADDAVVEKLGQPVLDELCARLTVELGRGHPADAICSVIDLAGDRLKPVLPRADDDINEVQDALVTLD